jgi:AraC-like DNA-binding protein
MGSHPDLISQWRERYRDIVRIDFEPLATAPFHVSFQRILKGVRAVQASFSPGTSFRDREMVRDGDDAYMFLISCSSDLDVRHRGHDLRLGMGDATLLHICSPARVGSSNRFAGTALLIPPAELNSRVSPVDDKIMRFLPRRSEALRMLRTYLRWVEHSLHGRSAEVRDLVQGHILDLAALALSANERLGECDLSAVAAARRGAILACLAERFRDPGLSEIEVAREQGISARYLQRLLESSGQPFTARLNELRLQWAYDHLIADDGGHLISGIALDAGFSDISHFNRLFHARFGATPGAIRDRFRRKH